MRKVIELAVDEARRMSHRSIGSEHLLLGILKVRTITSAPAPIGAALFTALGAAAMLCIVGVGGALVSCIGFFTPIRQQRA